jgi:glycerophosphoryl diester phosphodiesterase
MSVRPVLEYPFYADAQFPIAIAHRGGNIGGAENTVEAFEGAYKRGINYGETDTISTSDGVPLAYHGVSILHKNPHNLPARKLLESMTYEEVQDTIRIDGQPIPALADLLTSLPEMKFFIDPKTNKVARPLAKLIKDLNAENRVTIGSFVYNRTKAVAEALGGQERICTTMGALGSNALRGVGFIPGLDKIYADLPFTSFCLPCEVVEAKHVDLIHSAGKLAIVYSANTPGVISRSIDMHVDGLMSDETDELLVAIPA